MNPASGTAARHETLADLTLWACAGLVVLAVHAGAVVWLLRAPPVVPADDAPLAAIMIELADTPEAVMTEENDISPDQASAEASAPAQQMEGQEEAPPEETAETEPVTEPPQEPPLQEQEPKPVEPQTEAAEEELPLLDKVEVPMPARRPKPEKPTKPKEKPVQRRQAASAASMAAIQAQAQVAQASRNAARQSAAGQFSSMTPATWQSRLMAHLERRKRYPAGARSRGERGVAWVRFRIDDAGNVLSAVLARSSGFPELDAEVMSLVRRASPVPAPPPGVNRTITAPVRFNVR